MVVSKRILANTLFSFDINININSQEPFIGMAINMEVDTLKGWSVSSSSRATLVHSNVSSIICVEHVQALTNDLT